MSSKSVGTFVKVPILNVIFRPEFGPKTLLYSSIMVTSKDYTDEIDDIKLSVFEA